MKVSDVTDQAAKWLADEGNDMWDVPRLILLLQMSLHQLFNDRPDYMLSDEGLIDRTAEIDALDDESDDLPDSLDIRHKNPLAHLVCHYCYLEDADNTANSNLSTMHLKLYQGSVL